MEEDEQNMNRIDSSGRENKENDETRMIMNLRENPLKRRHVELTIFKMAARLLLALTTFLVIVSKTVIYHIPGMTFIQRGRLSLNS